MNKKNKSHHFELYVGNQKNEPTNQLLPLVARFDQQLLDDLLLNTAEKDPKLIIDHYRQQVKKAAESGPLNGSWVRFVAIIDLAETALLSNNQPDFGYYMHWLGQKAEFLSHWNDDEDFKKYIRIQISDYARTKGLRSKSDQQQWLREFCQDIAKLFWDNDTEHLLRTGHVAARVWNIVVDCRDDFADMGIDFLQLAGEQKTVRQWVSAVAPPYARKGGRPKT